ncbi:hypothetical protein [Streptomyces sp. NPDC046925]|uniref:hypothetical protein n=1 Tax=Streptomyces sp. NPDC046925 TaxID=3155375 RepID=UPI00340A3232
MNPQPVHPVIDTHVILRDGDQPLLSLRGGPYGRGRWHLPSGSSTGARGSAPGPPANCSKRPASRSTPATCAWRTSCTIG